MINEGNANDYCIEDISLIENYDKAISDKDHMWLCHHRLETHYEDGRYRPPEEHITKDELRKQKLYYMRPASELIFLTKKEHGRIHKTVYGYKFTDEQRAKLSRALKDKPKSEEHKRKDSEAAIRRHRLYIMLPNGDIMTTRECHDKYNVEMCVSDMNNYVRNKGYIVIHGERIPIINLGKDPAI